MLTSFFGKSKPINFVIFGAVIFLGYVFGALVQVDNALNLSKLLVNFFFIGWSVFAIFLLDFIVRKNDLTYKNTYTVLLFTCFLITLPVIFLDPNILLANVFLLMAFRRLASLSSEKNTERKILDASLWITVAALFYFWSILFFVLLFFSILQKSETNHRWFIIPFIGFAAIFILSVSFHLITNDSFLWITEWIPSISLDFSAYNNIQSLLPAAIMGTFLIWSLPFRLVKIASLSKKEKPNAILLLVTLAVCLFITFLSPQKTGAELFFIIAPLSVIVANYIENIQEFRFNANCIVVHMKALDLQIVETELQKRLQYPYVWGRKQNNLWDNYTNFIYTTPTWEALMPQMAEIVATHKLNKRELFNYTINRWYNFWSAMAVEQIFTNLPQVTPTKNRKNRS